MGVLVSIANPKLWPQYGHWTVSTVSIRTLPPPTLAQLPEKSTAPPFITFQLATKRPRSVAAAPEKEVMILISMVVPNRNLNPRQRSGNPGICSGALVRPRPPMSHLRRWRSDFLGRARRTLVGSNVTKTKPNPTVTGVRVPAMKPETRNPTTKRPHPAPLGYPRYWA